MINYYSYSFDVIKENFVGKNIAFFKAMYFDFAPLLAIPVYQERPVHSLKPIPDYVQNYSLKESEALANLVPPQFVVHPETKTQAILKSRFVKSADSVDETCITAYSYDIMKRLEIEQEFAGRGYGKFKPAVGEAVIETLRPIREEATRILQDKAYLESVYRAGAEKASYVANKTLRKVYKKIGFVAR